MEDVYKRTDAKVVMDSAFKVQAGNFLIKSSQLDPMDSYGLLLNRAATSVWQLSEHGMRMIQGQFPRLKDNMLLEEFGERRVILHLMVMLYNYQASTIGINTILNTFMPKIEDFKRDVNNLGKRYPFFYGHKIDATANNIFS